MSVAKNNGTKSVILLSRMPNQTVLWSKRGGLIFIIEEAEGRIQSRIESISRILYEAEPENRLGYIPKSVSTTLSINTHMHYLTMYILYLYVQLYIPPRIFKKSH